MKRLIVVSIIAIFSKTLAFSQGAFSLSAGIGGVYYYGDMNDKLVSHWRSLELSQSLELTYDFSRNIKSRFVIMHGSLSGADSLQKRKEIVDRNLSFQTDILEFSQQVIFALRQSKNFAIRNKSAQEKSYPYFFAGIGFFHFNPKAKIHGVTYDLKPLGTEGQNIANSGREPYKLWALSIPFGVGLSFNLSDNIDLNLEASYHKTFTDYLDDLSKTYPDSAAIGKLENGSLILQLTSRHLNGFPSIGSVRGNPKKDDNFMHFGFSLKYYFNKRPDFMPESW